MARLQAIADELDELAGRLDADPGDRTAEDRAAALVREAATLGAFDAATADAAQRANDAGEVFDCAAEALPGPQPPAVMLTPAQAHLRPIVAYLRQTEPSDDGEQASDAGAQGVTMADLREAIGVSNKTVQKYAKAAGVPDERLPGRGKRGFRVAGKDARTILKHAANCGGEKKIRDHAAHSLQNIEKKTEKK
jgi:hypothetical protein